MAFDESKYRKGYSIGVGGVVVHDKKVLLVRRVRGEDTGEWAIPGGFVEKEEKIEDAIIREIEEETNIKVKVTGLVAVRNRLYKDENSVYFIFLLKSTTEKMEVEQSEVDKAKFFTLTEIKKLKCLQTLSEIIVTKALEDKIKILDSIPQNEFPEGSYSIFG